MKPKTKRGTNVTVFREVDNTPPKFRGQLCPSNLNEEKEKFLKFGITPRFNLKESATDLDKATRKKRGQIHFGLFKEAKTVLDLVKKKFGDGHKYMDAAYGPLITQAEATETLMQYLNENNINGDIMIYWTPELTASAKMMWHGPNLRANKPEARKFTLIIKNSSENQMLRETGISCLADHELGTHFFRMVNDGLQPWFSDRKRFGLRKMKTREHVASEEGLASLNTIINAKSKFLYRPALLYYTACMCASMGFKEVFDHLRTYVQDKEDRWRLVMRVKRGIPDPGKHGGYGNDQCYFEGAVEILRNLDDIDFKVLHSGKVCVDEVKRVHRVARMDCIRIPKFLETEERYRKKLRHIALINNILPKCDAKPQTPPSQCSTRSFNTKVSRLTSTKNLIPASSLQDPRQLINMNKSIKPAPPSVLCKRPQSLRFARKLSSIRISPDTAQAGDSPSQASVTPQSSIGSPCSAGNCSLWLESTEDVNIESAADMVPSCDSRLLNRQQSLKNKLR